MIKQDFILLILNCEKYKNKAELQKIGWLKSLPESIIYFHIIGNISLETEYLFDIQNKILYVKTLDDYTSLPHKVIQSFLAINNEYDYKYIFKTDDDQHLTDPFFFNNLFKNIEVYKPNYGGNKIIIDDYISTYYIEHPELPRDILLKKTFYCNGRFYLLSKIAIVNLLEKKDKIKTEYIEDHAMGYYLDDDVKQSFLDIDNEVFKG